MNSRKFLVGLFLLAGPAFVSLTPVLAMDAPLKSLQRLVVLENGRLKPVDTYARNLLKQISGRSSYRNFSALEWLARMLYTPDTTLQDEIFLVNNPEVLDAIDVASRGRGRYSFQELTQSFATLDKLARELSQNEGRLSSVENEIMGLYNNILLYDQLLRTFAYASPQPYFKVSQGETWQLLNFNPLGGEFSYLDLLPALPRLREQMALIKIKPQDTLSPAEKEILSLASHMDEWAAISGPFPFAVIPRPAQNPETWVSPSETLSQTGINPDAIVLAKAANAFRERDFKNYSLIMDDFYESRQVPVLTSRNIRNLKLEILYNRFDPFFITEILTGISLLCLLLSLLFWKKLFYRFSLGMLAMAIVPHTFGIILRMLISGRPPVTNLYETFVFVAWIGALSGLSIELIQRKSLGLFCGGSAGLIFLVLAGKFSLDGDTMGMLAAVLSSNWWLAVHVITISVGYAGCIISGIIGHVYLLQKLLKPKEEPLLAATFRSLTATLAFGLVFTFIGTVMGGIWADQSWGRFWGWDPKENGALVIILWCAILLHARAARLVGQIGMSAGSVGLIITVILAWLGVNLLGVGKHSYGFTSGVTQGLFMFMLAEIIFLGIILILLSRRKKP
jgi:ABC-type transport system involved in cytochrome c biogenesis permease subunit